MNPSFRFTLSLLVSLVLWAPTALACLRGDVDLGAAGVRYLAGFLVAHLATGVLGRLATAYRRIEPDRRER